MSKAFPCFGCLISIKASIKLLEQKQVRTQWDDAEEKWYFSIIDVITILTGSERPRK